MGAELLHGVGRTDRDGRGETNIRFSQFCERPWNIFRRYWSLVVALLKGWYDCYFPHVVTIWNKSQLRQGLCLFCWKLCGVCLPLPLWNKTARIGPRRTSYYFNPESMGIFARHQFAPSRNVKKAKCPLVQALRLCAGRTAHSVSRGIALLFLDHWLEGGEGSASLPGRSLPQGKTRYPLYRRLGGPQWRSGQLRKISPPISSQSLYRLRYPAHSRHVLGGNFQPTWVVVLKIQYLVDVS